jgi:hypothetical protein
MNYRINNEIIQNPKLKYNLNNKINVINLVFPDISNSIKKIDLNKFEKLKNIKFSNYINNLPSFRSNDSNIENKNKKILVNKSTDTELINYSNNNYYSYKSLKKNFSDNILIKKNNNNYLENLKYVKPKIFDYLKQTKVSIKKPKIKKSKFFIKNHYEIKLNIFNPNENNFVLRNKKSYSNQNLEFYKTSNINNKLLENIKKNFYFNNNFFKKINYKLNSNRNLISKNFQFKN